MSAQFDLGYLEANRERIRELEQRVKKAEETPTIAESTYAIRGLDVRRGAKKARRVDEETPE